MISRLKQIPIGLLRLGVSVGLLYLIVSKVGLTAPLERVIGLDWPAVVGAAALILVTIALHTKRWLIVLNARRYSWHFLGALREMWIGYFFNQLLPTSVGGDGVRALRLHRSGMPGPLAVRVVLTERVFGFIACTLLGVLAVPVMLTLAPGAPATTAVGATVALGLFGILVLRLANTPVFRFLPKRLLYEVRQLGHAVHDHEFGAAAMAVSLAMQLCIAGAVGLLGKV